MSAFQIPQTSFDFPEFANPPQDGEFLQWDQATGRFEYAPASGGGGASEWGAITGDLTDQTDLQTVLDSLLTQAEADALYGQIAHDHSIAAITNLQATLDAKLALAGGTMLGLLTLSGAPVSDFDASTKKYVDDSVAALLDSSPALLDTLNELAAAIGDDPNFAATQLTLIGEKLAKAANLSDLTDASQARTNLALVPGTNVQAFSANLTTFAGIAPSANMQSLLAAADYAAMRTALGLVIGTNVQAQSARLAEVATIGTANQQIRVNAGGTALEYFDASGSGANAALSNLASVAINTDLLPASTQKLGSATFPFNESYIGTTTQYEKVSQSAGIITHAALGSATNIGVTITPKGTGVLQVNSAITYTGTSVSGSLGSLGGRELNIGGGSLRYNYNRVGAFEVDNDLDFRSAASAHFAGAGGVNFAPAGLVQTPTVGIWYNSTGKVEFNDGFNAGAYRDFIARQMYIDQTVTASGTTGDRTINRAAGTVNIASGNSSVTVTNNLVAATSLVFAVIRTNDSTAIIKNVVPAAGSFVITLNAAASAEVSIGFLVVNGPN